MCIPHSTLGRSYLKSMRPTCRPASMRRSHPGPRDIHAGSGHGPVHKTRTMHQWFSAKTHIHTTKRVCYV